MTIDEMFNELEDKARDTFIVTLKYKYDFEENYTIENNILEYDSLDDSYIWLNDWCEGQTDIEVLGYMLLSDVDTAKPLTCEDCISRKDAIRIAEQGQIQGYEWQFKKLCILPSVIPEPKKGKWIGGSICNRCNYQKMPLWQHNYCPNCGAKMEEVEK